MLTDDADPQGGLVLAVLVDRLDRVRVRVGALRAVVDVLGPETNNTFPVALIFSEVLHSTWDVFLRHLNLYVN